MSANPAPPTERERARLRERAELAQMVAFSVAGSEYAIDIMRIKEIINPVAIRPVPKALPFVEGVIELRGSILPVLDMRRRFDCEATAFTRQTKFLVVGLDLGGSCIICGLIVDRVSEPLRVPRAEIRPAPQLSDTERVFFTGVVHHQGQMLMVLDLDAILSTGEKRILLGAAEGGGE